MTDFAKQLDATLDALRDTLYAAHETAVNAVEQERDQLRTQVAGLQELADQWFDAKPETPAWTPGSVGIAWADGLGNLTRDEDAEYLTAQAIGVEHDDLPAGTALRLWAWSDPHKRNIDPHTTKIADLTPGWYYVLAQVMAGHWATADIATIDAGSAVDQPSVRLRRWLRVPDKLTTPKPEPTVPATPIDPAGDPIRDSAELQAALNRLDGKGGTLRLVQSLRITKPIQLRSGRDGLTLRIDGDNAVAIEADRCQAFVGDTVRHAALVGLTVRPVNRDPYSGQDGIKLYGACRDVAVMSCDFDGFAGAVVLLGRANARMRDIRIVESWIANSHRNADQSAGAGRFGHSSGGYSEYVDDLLLDANLFDHNGWTRNGKYGTYATMFNHGWYAQKNCGVVYVYGNVFLDSSSHGIQCRGGGLVKGNVFAGNPIGVLVQQAASLVQANLIVAGRDISAGQGRGTGVWVSPCSHAKIIANIIADQRTNRDWAHAIQADDRDDHTIDVPAKPWKIDIRDNRILDWATKENDDVQDGIVIHRAWAKALHSNTYDERPIDALPLLGGADALRRDSAATLIQRFKEVLR